jgi:GntR family transcriptional regulator / MocR family aminotransferase
LLAWAREADAWVIEGDHFGEVLHGGASPKPLWCADGGQRVLYFGSYNHVMFPGLRVSYLVLPEALVDAFCAVRGMMGDHPPVGVQQTLAAFIDEGHLARHLRLLRPLLQARRDAVLRCAAHSLPPAARLGPLLGGSYGTVRLPDEVDDVALAAALGARGLGLDPLSVYAAMPHKPRGLVFGYGSDDEARIERAFSILGPALQRWLAEGSA